MDFAQLLAGMGTLSTTAETVIGVVAAVAATGIAIVLGRKLFAKG